MHVARWTWNCNLYKHPTQRLGGNTITPCCQRWICDLEYIIVYLHWPFTAHKPVLVSATSDIATLPTPLLVSEGNNTHNRKMPYLHIILLPHAISLIWSLNFEDSRRSEVLDTLEHFPQSCASSHPGKLHWYLLQIILLWFFPRWSWWWIGTIWKLLFILVTCKPFLATLPHVIFHKPALKTRYSFIQFAVSSWWIAT